MTKNKKVMSIAILPELHDALKLYARRKAMTVSTYIGNVIEQVTRINIDDDPMVIGKPTDDDIIPVVLKIPKSLRQSPDRLKQWMEVQTNGIIRAMEQR